MKTDERTMLMKKRVISLALILVLALSLCVPASAADIRTVNTTITYREISIIINGTEIAPCDEKGNPTEPFIMNDTTYLPVRAIANALGLGVEWIPATSTIALTSGGEVNYGSGAPAATKATKSVDITYRGTKISLDGEPVALVNANGEAVEPFILAGTNYLPLRIVGEALGLAVAWDSATSTVTLSKKSTETVWAPAGMRFTGGETGGDYSELVNIKYEYDALGRLTAMYSTDSRIELRCSYDKSGSISQLDYKVPGVRTSYKWEYDADGEPIAFYENGTLMEAYSCETDAEGRIVKEYITENGWSKVNEYTYDEKGRIASEKLGDYSGLVFEYSYDEYDRVVKKYERDVNFPEGGAEYTYSYDERGNLVKMDQFNHYMGYAEYTKEYSYDRYDRLTEEVWTWSAPYGADNTMRTSSKNVYSYEYDQYGNLSMYEEATYYNELFDGGVSFYLFELIRESYSYDAEGRMLSARFYSEPPGDAFTEDEQYYYSYNGAGLLTEEKYVLVRGGDKLIESVYKYSYDAAGRLTGESFSETNIVNGDSSYQQSYSYNAKGEPAASSYTDSEGNSLYEQYIYDNLGRMVSYTVTENGAATRTLVEYNAEDLPTRMETVSYGEGVTVITEMSYVKIPAAEMDNFLAALVGQIESML